MTEGARNSQSGILGVILAGGASRRMGGGDKGLADFAGRPLLSQVIERFAPQVEVLILNANGAQDRFARFKLPVVPDLDRRALGPLAGILATMDWVKQSAPAIKAIATVTSDVPFLPDNLVARLSGGAAFGPSIAVSNGRRHPAIALWPIWLKDAVEDALRNDQLSVNAFAARNNAVEVAFPLSEADGQMIHPFFNINAPSDLAEARAIAARAKL